eukprot:6914757-Alexandrium_andersonii.AAC.1
MRTRTTSAATSGSRCKYARRANWGGRRPGAMRASQAANARGARRRTATPARPFPHKAATIQRGRSQRTMDA